MQEAAQFLICHLLCFWEQDFCLSFTQSSPPSFYLFCFIAFVVALLVQLPIGWLGSFAIAKEGERSSKLAVLRLVVPGM